MSATTSLMSLRGCIKRSPLRYNLTDGWQSCNGLMHRNRISNCGYFSLINSKRCSSSHQKSSETGVRKVHSVSQENSKESDKLELLKAAIQQKIESVPSLNKFAASSNVQKTPFVINNRNRNPSIPYLTEEDLNGKGKRVYFEVFGCQMNFNDTQLAQTILMDHGYEVLTEYQDANKADVYFLMTCSIRDGAEAKIWKRLEQLRRGREKGSYQIKQIGLLGCMAERLKTKLIETENPLVNIVCGPDAYRDLPKLLAVNSVTGQNAVNVLLSLDETYSDIVPINPVTIRPNQKTAYVSIMRGCENMCSFCIVPFTRGRERSRPIESITNEVKRLSEHGIKEVMLLGQNVNSYRYKPDADIEVKSSDPGMAKGFKTVYKQRTGGLTFDILLDEVARVDPEMRVRFTSPHPKDFPDAFLEVINRHPNICKCIHLPAQSGSNAVLERMRRGYTREAYLELVARIKEIVPGVSLTSDFIAGFCGETEEDHQMTLDLIERVGYSFMYFFPYSMREKTHAYHHYKDDVPLEVKNRRVREISLAFRKKAEQVNKKFLNTTQLLLVEGNSRRSDENVDGRCDGYTKIVIPKLPIPNYSSSEELIQEIKMAERDIGYLNSLESDCWSSPQPGDYVAVYITDTTSQTLVGIPLFKTSLNNFYEKNMSKMIETIGVEPLKVLHRRTHDLRVASL